jgi:hypothetical protein
MQDGARSDACRIVRNPDAVAEQLADLVRLGFTFLSQRPISDGRN